MNRLLNSERGDSGALSYFVLGTVTIIGLVTSVGMAILTARLHSLATYMIYLLGCIVIISSVSALIGRWRGGSRGAARGFLWGLLASPIVVFIWTLLATFVSVKLTHR
jgi:hypothetical protein